MPWPTRSGWTLSADTAGAPLRVPFVETLQLVRQNARLQAVEFAVVADGHVIVLVPLAERAHLRDPLRQLRLVGDDRAGIAGGGQVLTRMEAETAGGTR